MTAHAHPTDDAATRERAARLGLTALETAEKRRRIAEIAWLIAQAKAKSAEIEAALEDPTITPRAAASKKLAIAEVAYEVAMLRHEQAHHKADLAEDKAKFPR